MGLVEREAFEALVARAVEKLPPEFQERLENIDIVVEELPTRSQLTKAGLRYPAELLGLYEGVPLTKRGINYTMVLPDKITIFQKPIEAKCRTHEEIELEVKRVVCHEIAHYFGMSEASLNLLEKIPKNQGVKNGTKRS